MPKIQVKYLAGNLAGQTFEFESKTKAKEEIKGLKEGEDFEFIEVPQDPPSTRKVLVQFIGGNQSFHLDGKIVTKKNEETEEFDADANGNVQALAALLKNKDYRIVTKEQLAREAEEKKTKKL